MTTTSPTPVQIQTLNSSTTNSDTRSRGPFHSPRRKPRGKIAELPKTHRDLINHLLDDGATYRAVCAEMAKHAVKLNPENVSNWFNTGYQVHVDHQLWLNGIIEVRESASELSDHYDPVKFHQAVNQLATVQIFKALKSLKFNDDPHAFARILNALARLGREALALKKAKDDDEPLFNIPDDEDAGLPGFASLRTLLARMKTPPSNQNRDPGD